MKSCRQVPDVVFGKHTKLLRERYLGAKRELGGYDNCTFMELKEVCLRCLHWPGIMYDFQIHALDMLDSSHSLGGVESCEKVMLLLWSLANG